MFLNELNQKESEAFVNLVKQLAMVDNDFAKSEQELVADYIEELGVDESKVAILDNDTAISMLKDSTERIKNIIYLELVGLALIDGKYLDEEVDFLEKVAFELNIARHKRIAFANFYMNFKDIYDFTVVDSDSKLELIKKQVEAII